ncbi:MAG: hypothetical protein RIS92_2105 [Verrucomicrobiota bacterium]
MHYSVPQIDDLHENLRKVLQDMQDLILKTVIEEQALDPASPVRGYLGHGAARRLRTIRRAVQRVFELFPLNQVRPLEADALSDVQTNLHAFVMNLYGLYDNWAWAFVLRHDLLSKIGDHRRVGLFRQATQKHLPEELRLYIKSDVLKRWHDEYAKPFRDALAHRIPPYVPPSEFTEEEGRRYNELEAEKFECIKNMQWGRFDELSAEQAALGRPSFVFLHAFVEEGAPRRILLHPQLLADGMAAVEFGRLFLQYWRTVPLA